MTSASMLAGVERIAALADDRSRESLFLIAIDGMSGSGKSSLADALAEVCSAVVIRGDDFYRPLAAEDRLKLSPDEGYEWYFDWQRLREEVLIPLASGRTASYGCYDWATGGLMPQRRVVAPTGMVVVEGVYAARPELADYYDLLVYVDTPAGESLGRLRDRGHDHGPIDWVSRWRQAEEHYLATTRPRDRVDLVVSGSSFSQ